MDRALAGDREVSMASDRPKARRKDQRLEFGRAEGEFALAHVLALLTAIAAAVLLRYSTSVEGLGTPAALCLGATVGLMLLGRRNFRILLTKEARQKGLGPVEAREYVERHLARQAGPRIR